MSAYDRGRRGGFHNEHNRDQERSHHERRSRCDEEQVHVKYADRRRDSSGYDERRRDDSRHSETQSSRYEERGRFEDRSRYESGRDSPRGHEFQRRYDSPRDRELQRGYNSPMGREFQGGRDSPMGREFQGGRDSPREREFQGGRDPLRGRENQGARDSPRGREFQGGRDSPREREIQRGRDSLRGRENQGARDSPRGREGGRDSPRGFGSKRPRDSAFGPPRGGKFQKRGRGGRGRGRGGRQPKPEKPEFFDSIVTKPENLTSKQGECGENDQIVRLTANYFKIPSLNPISMKIFSIYFEPNVYNPKFRKILVSNISNELGAHVYDDVDMMYLMNDPPKTTFSTTLRDGTPYDIRLKYRRDVNYTEANFMQILNLIFRQSMKLMKLEQVGRVYCDPHDSVNVHAAKLQMWPGFVTAIRQYEESLLLCCDLIYKVIREETVLDILNQLRDKCTSEKNYRELAKKQIRGMTVITTYNNKTYRIDDIDFNLNPSKGFPCGDTEKSYIQYYTQQYGARIDDHRQPLLVSNPKARDLRGGRKHKIILIPELCCPVGLSDEMRNNYRMMKTIQDKIRMTPEQRVQRLLAFNGRIKNEGNQPLIENKLEIENQLVEFDGRKMPEQKIVFGLNENNEHIKVDLSKATDPADWTSNLKSVVLFEPVTVVRWAVMYPASLKRQTEEFVGSFLKAGSNLGMSISSKIKFIEMINDKEPTYVEHIDQLVNKDQLKNCRFILIVVPNTNGGRYSAIKRTTLCHRVCTPTQVITLKAMEKTGLSVATKVAIQVNCKLGGIPWTVSIPVKGLLTIGFSITQDTNDRKNMYGAMVAQMRPGDAKSSFYSCVNPHSRGSTISEFFGLNVITMVNRYISVYKSLPEQIIIYRDGCGEGQIQIVFEQEVKDVENKLNKLYREHEQKPKFAFIIINKRINTRIFSKSGRSYENPAPGTVVDSVITLPERYDFYLISQSVTQGTVAPTSYNIVHDTSELEAKDIQLVTYKMCHLYYNWSGTTRIPSVVQYAQKLAFLFGQHLHSCQSEVLYKSEDNTRDSELYYL